MCPIKLKTLLIIRHPLILYVIKKKRAGNYNYDTPGTAAYKWFQRHYILEISKSWNWSVLIYVFVELKLERPEVVWVKKPEVVSGLFCCLVSDKPAVWGLASWSLQFGVWQDGQQVFRPSGLHVASSPGAIGLSWKAFYLDHGWKPGKSRFPHPEQILLPQVPGKHETWCPLPWEIKPEWGDPLAFNNSEELQSQWSFGWIYHWDQSCPSINQFSHKGYVPAVNKTVQNLMQTKFLSKS